MAVLISRCKFSFLPRDTYNKAVFALSDSAHILPPISSLPFTLSSRLSMPTVSRDPSFSWAFPLVNHDATEK